MKEGLTIIQNQEDEIMTKTLVNSLRGLDYLANVEDQMPPQLEPNLDWVHNGGERIIVPIDEELKNMIKVIGFKAYCYLIDNGMHQLAMDIGREAGMPVDNTVWEGPSGSSEIVDKSFPKGKLQRIFKKKI